ncbi:hypothetical protein L1887_55178 [Cichorium endivia]|nr:hypothetical protein L1887_55178 [Cichorium endivia]
MPQVDLQEVGVCVACLLFWPSHGANGVRNAPTFFSFKTQRASSDSRQVMFWAQPCIADCILERESKRGCDRLDSAALHTSCNSADAAHAVPASLPRREVHCIALYAASSA